MWQQTKGFKKNIFMLTYYDIELVAVSLVWLYKRKPHFRFHSRVKECIHPVIVKCSVRGLFQVYKNKNIATIHKPNTRKNVVILTMYSAIRCSETAGLSTWQYWALFLFLSTVCSEVQGLASISVVALYERGPISKCYLKPSKSRLSNVSFLKSTRVGILILATPR